LVNVSGVTLCIKWGRDGAGSEGEPTPSRSPRRIGTLEAHQRGDARATLGGGWGDRHGRRFGHGSDVLPDRESRTDDGEAVADVLHGRVGLELRLVVGVAHRTGVRVHVVRALGAEDGDREASDYESVSTVADALAEHRLGREDLRLLRQLHVRFQIVLADALVLHGVVALFLLDVRLLQIELEELHRSLAVVCHLGGACCHHEHLGIFFAIVPVGLKELLLRLVEQGQHLVLILFCTSIVEVFPPSFACLEGPFVGHDVFLGFLEVRLLLGLSLGRGKLGKCGVGLHLGFRNRSLTRWRRLGGRASSADLLLALDAVTRRVGAVLGLDAVDREKLVEEHNGLLAVASHLGAAGSVQQQQVVRLRRHLVGLHVLDRGMPEELGLHVLVLLGFCLVDVLFGRACLLLEKRLVVSERGGGEHHHQEEGDSHQTLFLFETVHTVLLLAESDTSPPLREMPRDYPGCSPSCEMNMFLSANSNCKDRYRR
jgi:hypothetical protein